MFNRSYHSLIINWSIMHNTWYIWTITFLLEVYHPFFFFCLTFFALGLPSYQFSFSSWTNSIPLLLRGSQPILPRNLSHLGTLIPLILHHLRHLRVRQECCLDVSCIPRDQLRINGHLTPHLNNQKTTIILNFLILLLIGSWIITLTFFLLFLPLFFLLFAGHYIF